MNLVYMRSTNYVNSIYWYKYIKDSIQIVYMVINNILAFSHTLNEYIHDVQL
jgi:hypothetical protein